MKKRPLGIVCLMIILILGFAAASQPVLPPQNDIYEGERVSVTGRVLRKETIMQSNGEAWVLYLDKLSEASPPGEGAVCYLKKEQIQPPVGSTVRLEGIYKSFEAPSNPGQFDAYSYYQISGISYRLNQAVIQEQSTKYSILGETLDHIKGFWSEKLSFCLPEKESALMKTVLLGEKGELDRELKALYQRNGIAHILAISGLHVSMLGMGLYRLLRRCGIPMKVAAVLAAGILVLYGMMTGFSVSAIRAILMFSLRMLAVVTERSYDRITALAAAAVIILIGQPYYLLQSGFVFSFGCVLGLSVLTPALTQDKKGRLRDDGKLPFRMVKVLLSALSMAVITLPVYLWYYYQFPVWSVLLNLIVIPLMSYLMAAGILLLAASVLCPIAVLPLSMIIKGICRIYELACGLSDKLPMQLLNLGRPEKWQMIVYLAVLLLIILMKKKLTLPGKWILTIAAVFILSIRTCSGLELTFLDVGQGDGIFIRAEEGYCFLVDGGSSSVSNVGEYRIIPFLKYKGVRKLDAVFVTHPDTDHCNGIKELLVRGRLNGIRVEQLILPDVGEEARDEAYMELVYTAEQEGISVAYISRGQSFSKGQLILTCLHPKEGYEVENANAYSLVLELDYGNFSALLTGDLEGEGEEELLSYMKGSQTKLRDTDQERPEQGRTSGGFTVLKVAHHGSKYSTDSDFLEWARPCLAVISCGTNSYGHPAAETLKRLADCGSEVLITEKDGAITVHVDEGHITIKQYRNF